MRTPKKFQVFISSTYEDLTLEREIVSLAVLRSQHIPSGMELSSGANERTLDVIFRWIDDCDIFILLLGGRYGTIDPPTGLSYTELEYDYAKSRGKPVIAVALTTAYLAAKVARGSTTAEIAYERQYGAQVAAFRERVAAGSFCIYIADIGELEAKILTALDSVRVRQSASGWIRVAAVVDRLLDVYARYVNRYLAIERDGTLRASDIEDLLRLATDVVREFVCADLGWIDVMVPVRPTRADDQYLLIADAHSEPGWLRVVYSSVRRTNPPTLIPVEVNGVPWRGSGNAFACHGIDYVSSFRGRYARGGYDLPAGVVDRIEAQYAYWREQHYFSALLAIAITSPHRTAVRPLGVLNLNFSAEDPLGADDTLSPQRSIALVNVLEPVLLVLARVIGGKVQRKWRPS